MRGAIARGASGGGTATPFCSSVGARSHDVCYGPQVILAPGVTPAKAGVQPRREPGAPGRCQGWIRACAGMTWRALTTRGLPLQPRRIRRQQLAHRGQLQAIAVGRVPQRTAAGLHVVGVLELLEAGEGFGRGAVLSAQRSTPMSRTSSNARRAEVRETAENFRRVARKFRDVLLKYSPDQPRAPAGQPDGGQWIPWNHELASPYDGPGRQPAKNNMKATCFNATSPSPPDIAGPAEARRWFDT